MSDDASSAERAAGWRPIETAPLSEEVLLGYYGDDTNWYGAIWKGHVFQWEGMPRPLTTGSRAHRATHWMPLPAPPDPQEHLARRGR